MNVFKGYFFDMVQSVPNWLLPELTMKTVDRVVYDYVSIDFITNANVLIGKKYDIAYVSDNVSREIRDKAMCVCRHQTSF